jgi:hypothetical protein
MAEHNKKADGGYPSAKLNLHYVALYCERKSGEAFLSSGGRLALECVPQARSISPGLPSNFTNRWFFDMHLLLG